MSAPDLDVYVESARSFARARHYIVRRALDALGPAGLAYRLLEGPPSGPRAPVALVHVDLTVVPPDRRPAPGAYAVCLNGAATDIARTRYSTARLARDADWRGAVIVKSVLNHRGLPELRDRRRRSLLFRLRLAAMRALGRDPKAALCPAYEVHASLADVPPATWDDPARLVERFLAPRPAPPVVKHRLDFFLDVSLHTRSVFDSLLADPASVREVSVVEGVPPAVDRVRRALGLDFGAIDYFVADGEAVVVDANKTTTIDDDWVRDHPAVARHMGAVSRRLVEVVRSRSLAPTIGAAAP